ncbi:MAG: corrinoid protein [Proteobacteria bacterium]|nr:corrinoid protein [Pseudomonadota bacterium]
MSSLETIVQVLQQGDRDQVRRLVEEALDQGIEPETILKSGLILGMDAVGAKFEAGEFFIPHMLLAARAMHVALEVLKPRLAESGAEPAGRVVLGTVKGDLHDIGKNLVAMMLEGKGFEVVDLGMDAAPEAFVQAIDDSIRIVAMSALLSTTAPFLKETIEAIERAGLRDRVRIMVGGGAVTQNYADAIGADAYGRDAAAAARLAVDMVA